MAWLCHVITKNPLDDFSPFRRCKTFSGIRMSTFAHAFRTPETPLNPHTDRATIYLAVDDISKGRKALRDADLVVVARS